MGTETVPVAMNAERRCTAARDPQSVNGLTDASDMTGPFAPAAGPSRSVSSFLCGRPACQHSTDSVRSQPVLDKHLEWCEHEANIVLDESPIPKVTEYSLNHERVRYRFRDKVPLTLEGNSFEKVSGRAAPGKRQQNRRVTQRAEPTRRERVLTYSTRARCPRPSPRGGSLLQHLLMELL
jgi:hypothetical protein